MRDLSVSTYETGGRWRFDWVLPVLFRPRRAGNFTPQSSQQVLNVTAWSLLPFALRDMVRTVAMWNNGQELTSLGLSGFAPAGEGTAFLYLAALLTFVDIYLLWHWLLLGKGLALGANLGKGKTWTAVLLTVLVIFLLRGVPALISAQFSDLTVIRPFF